MICAWLELRFVTIKRRNPIDFGRFRSEGGGLGESEPPFRLGNRAIAPERGSVGHCYLSGSIIHVI